MPSHVPHRTQTCQTRLNPRAYPYKEDFKKRLDAILADLEREGVIYRIVSRYDAIYALHLRSVGI